jgi:PAS domain S-box-containing protein
MTWQAGLYFGIVLAMIVISLFLVWQAWRQRDVAGSHFYFWLALALGLAALEEVLSMLSPTQAWALFWFKTRFLSFAVIPSLWLLFVLEYSGRSNWHSTGLVIGLFVIPLVTQVMIWTNGWHGLWVLHDVGFQKAGPFWSVDVTQRVPGLWFMVHIIFGQLLLLAGSILLLRTAWRKARLFRFQAILLTGSALVPLYVAVVTTFNLVPKGAINPSMPGFALASMLAAAAVFRFDFLKKAPASGEAVLIGDAREKQSLALFLLTFGLLATAITAAGFISYRILEQKYRTQVDGQLTAIAALKVGEIEGWRNELLSEGEELLHNAAFSALVQSFLENQDNGSDREQLQSWLDALRNADSFGKVFLVDANGLKRISSPPEDGPVAGHVQADVAATLAGGQVVFLDFHRHDEQTIRLGVLTPVYAGQDVNQPLGILVMEIDPATYLFPYLSQWPLPSESAETLLVRRDGDSVIFLNPLRFQPDAALRLRIPLQDTEILAVKAVLGQRGVVEGVDYRGQDVIGALAAVPGMPWFLVARLDRAEAYILLRQRQWQTLLFFGGLMAISGIGMTLSWRQQQVRSYRKELKTLDALRASEEKFRLAFDTSPDAMAITNLADGRFVSVNQGFEQILGYSAAEVLGRTSLEIEVWDDPRDRQKIVSALQEKGAVANFEARFRARDGAVRSGMMSATIIQLGGEPHILNITHDITNRKKAEDTLRESERKYRTLFNEMLSGMAVHEIICDAKGVPVDYRFLAANPAFERITGLKVDDILGKTVKEVLPGIESVWIDRYGKVALTRKAVQFDERSDPLGKSFEVRAFSPEPGVFATLFNDITERKQAELEVRELNARLEQRVEERTRELRAAQERLVRHERLAMLGKLAGSVSHELRNPLGVIANAVYYLGLAQPEAGDKIKEYLEIIDKETRIADKIISDLLDFSRIKSAELEPVLINELVIQALERYPIPESIQITLKMPRELPYVYADRQQVMQVLGNLLTNACQAMPGGGALTIRGKLSSSNGQPFVSISIKDSGVGIPPENAGKIFEPLFTTKAKGIGLGLAICKSLVEANGGQIEFKSELNKGSQFTLSLPVYREQK